MRVSVVPLALGVAAHAVTAVANGGNTADAIGAAATSIADGGVDTRTAADVAVALAHYMIDDADARSYFTRWAYGPSIMIDAMLLGTDPAAEAGGLGPKQFNFTLEQWVNPQLDGFLHQAGSPAYNITHGERISPSAVGTAIGDTVGLFPHTYLHRYTLFTAHPELAPPGYTPAADLAVARDIADGYVLPWKIRWTDGTLSRDVSGDVPAWPQDGHHQYIWGDDGYMGLTLPSRLAVAGLDHGNGTYARFAAEQHALLTSHLRDDADGLYFHGRDAETGAPSCCKWGRANGWAMMMHTEVLAALHADAAGRGLRARDDPAVAAATAAFVAHARALAAVQNATDGRWHQLLNDTETFLETSCTAMFTVALAHGVRHGWLDAAEFTPVLRLAWAGLQRAIAPSGYVADICDGFGIHATPAEYKACPRAYNRSTPGLGSVLKAAVLMSGF